MKTTRVYRMKKINKKGPPKWVQSEAKYWAAITPEDLRINYSFKHMPLYEGKPRLKKNYFGYLTRRRK